MINDDTIFNTACVESIYERFTGKKFEQRRYIHLVFHAMEYSDAHIMTTKVSYDNME